MYLGANEGQLLLKHLNIFFLYFPNNAKGDQRQIGLKGEGPKLVFYRLTLSPPLFIRLFILLYLRYL